MSNSPAPSLPASDGELSDHAPIDSTFYGDNSPTKRACHSKTWKDIKRLKKQLPDDPDNKSTHICIVKLPAGEDGGQRMCNQKLTLHKNNPKGVTKVKSWLTTKANDHLAQCHPVDSEAGADAVKRGAHRAVEKVGVVLDYGMPDDDGVSIDPVSKFRLSKRERSLSAQAQWYVYSSMRVSKGEFESVFFKTMLKETGDGPKTAILTQANLKDFLKAEWTVFFTYLRVILKEKNEQAMGNGFAQALHDGGTLQNKKKFQALALQFIAPGWKKNIVLTIGLIKSLRNKDQDVADLWRSTMTKRTGFDYDTIVTRMRADRAAKGVAGALGMDEEEVCEMHDTDKLGRSGLGGLVRTKNKVEINPFPEGVALVKKAHGVGAYFGYSTRRFDLSEVGKGLGNCPDITIKVDYNTTRIAAVHGLLHSELRLNRALKAYALKYTPGWALSSEDWRVAADFEAVLNCTRVTSTLAQIETKYMAAFTMLIKQLAMTKLRAKTLDVIDLNKVTADPKLPRTSVAVDCLSKEGQTVRERATVEGERRWCGNKGEVLEGGAISMGRHELLAMLLDKRTLGCQHVTADVRNAAIAVYLEEYAKFARTAKAYNCQAATERLAAEQAAPEATATTALATVPSGLASGNTFGVAAWGSDDDDDEDDADEDEDEVITNEAKAALKAWRKYKVEWLDMYPDLKKKKKVDEPLDLVEDLMQLDIGRLYKHVEGVDQGRKLYGWIPLMASCSTGQLGALSAESYCERVLSCANNVLVKGNTLLSDEEVEMLVVLRMNRGFMQFMREYYKKEAKKAFEQTGVG